MCQPTPGATMERFFPALVAPTQDSHLATLCGQGSGQALDHGGLARASHSQVANHHDQATQRLIPQDSITVEIYPQANQAGKNMRKGP
jgi:hypothetical protein